MPNHTNVDRPIVLVGQGRSGTSLVSSLFSHHPDCGSVGETGNLIFGVWYAIRVSVSVIPPLVEDGRTVGDDERAGRLVRDAFLATLPDDKAYWMQKPIGVPRALSDIYGKARGGDEAASVFWRVLRTSFPRARFFTILRHPCDVVLSALAHWGHDQRAMWDSLADLAKYMLHPDAPPLHAVSYDRLVRDREGSVRELCAAVGLPFDAAMLQAFDQIHVPAPGRSDPSVTEFSRRHEWETLDGRFVTEDNRKALTDLFAKFGHHVEWPDTFGTSLEPVGPVSQAERIDELEAILADTRLTFERTRLEYADQTQAREREFKDHLQAREEHFARVWAEQRGWIDELERAKTWLDEQMQYWRGEADRLKSTGGQ